MYFIQKFSKYIETSCVPDTFLNCRAAVMSTSLVLTGLMFYCEKTANRKYQIVVSTVQRIKLGYMVMNGQLN